jgi:hypothetical protein
MLGQGRARLGWTGRVIALAAILALTLRAVLPVPAAMEGRAGPAAMLLAAGATLCHADDGGTGTPLPADTPCDHCALCAALLVPPPLHAPATPHPPGWIAAAPSRPRAAAPAESAQDPANRPRGPPLPA